MFLPSKTMPTESIRALPRNPLRATVYARKKRSQGSVLVCESKRITKTASRANYRGAVTSVVLLAENLTGA